MPIDFANSLEDPKIRPTQRPAVLERLPEPGAEDIFCPILSVDDHALEPATLFEGRVESAFVDAMPQVVYDDEGIPGWMIDGSRFTLNMMNGPIGSPKRQWVMAPLKYEEFREGVADSSTRLHDLDLNGIYGSLCFPSLVWGFAGSRFASMKDEKAGLAGVRAYNRWMLEEWCGAAPDRYVSCQLPWLRDPVTAASEVRSNADLGFKSVSFSENPEQLGFGSIHGDYWDPFFRACAETNTVVNLHVGSSGIVSMPSSSSPAEVGVALFPVNSIIAAVDWVFSRLTIKFPDLKIVFSEGGVSWVPMVVERLTRAERQIDVSMVWDRSDPSPVDLLRKNFWFASIEDPSLFQSPAGVDLNHVMVEVDYPHADTTWPDAQDMVRRELQHLDAATIKRICFENAAALYRHPLPQAELLARSEVARMESGSKLNEGGIR